jgi:hypothetical protein
MIQFESNITRLKDLPNLRFHDIAGQAVFGNSEVEHAAGDRRGLEDRHGVAHKGKVVRGRKSDRTSSNYCHPEREFLLAASFIDVDGALRFGTVLLGEESLQRANRNRLVNLAAATGSFARMRTDSSANAGQGIRIAR